jgi:hypothetical protein
MLLRATLPLFLSALPGAPEARPALPDARLVRPPDFASLTAGRALGLVGRRALYWVVLDSPDDEHDGQTRYECAGRDDAYRTLSLAAGEEAFEGDHVEVVVVRATPRVSHHPAWVGQGGTGFEGFTEYRLLGARRP